MDKIRRKELIEIYKNCADDDLIEMIEEGKDSYEEGAYELILAEADKRGLNEESDYGGSNYDGSDYNEGDEDTIYEEINFNKMSDQDLMGVLINIHTLDELNFHLAAAEAIRRNIDASDIRALKRIVNCEQCSDTVEIEIIEDPRPLIILKTIDEANLYTDTLDDEGIAFEIQIIVDDRDYKKAQMATNNIVPSREEE